MGGPLGEWWASFAIASSPILPASISAIASTSGAFTHSTQRKPPGIARPPHTTHRGGPTGPDVVCDMTPRFSPHALPLWEARMSNIRFHASNAFAANLRRTWRIPPAGECQRASCGEGGVCATSAALLTNRSEFEPLTLADGIPPCHSVRQN